MASLEMALEMVMAIGDGVGDGGDHTVNIRTMFQSLNTFKVVLDIGDGIIIFFKIHTILKDIMSKPCISRALM